MGTLSLSVPEVPTLAWSKAIGMVEPFPAGGGGSAQGLPQELLGKPGGPEAWWHRLGAF